MNQKTKSMKTQLLKYAGIMLVLLVSFSACKKELGDVTPDASVEKITAMQDMKVSDDFSWKTIQDVDVDFAVSNTSSLIIKSAGGAIYHKALVPGGTKYQTKITLPTYEKEVTVVVNGQPTLLALEGNKLTKNF